MGTKILLALLIGIVLVSGHIQQSQPIGALEIPEENKEPVSEPTPTPSPVPTPTTTPSTFTGGVVQYYLVQSVWGGYWQQLNPLQILHENGVEWVQVRLTTESSSDLRNTSPEDWGTLPWKWEYYHDGSLEYVEQSLKEASDIGMRLNLVFFLSDEIAYAGLQNAPPEWQDLTVDELALQYMIIVMRRQSILWIRA